MADVIDEKELDWAQTDASDGPAQESEAEQPEEDGEESQIESEEGNEESEGDPEQESDGESDESEEESEEDEFFFGDEKLESPTNEEDDADTAPQWVKDLRKTNREQAKELRELKKQLDQTVQQSQPDAMGLKEPSIWDEGIDGDEDVFKAKWSEYHQAKSKKEQAEKARQEQQEQFLQNHQEKLNQYNERKSKVKFKGYDRAEQVVMNEVPEQIQGAIIHYAEKPEMVVMALGGNQELRKQISQATDPVQLGRLIGNIEAKVRTAPKAKKQTSSAPSVKGQNGGKRLSAEDKAFYQMFPDAKIN